MLQAANMDEGELLSHLLLHRWVAGRSEDGPVWPQHWLIHIHDSSIYMYPTNLYTIHPLHGQSSAGVRIQSSL